MAEQKYQAVLAVISDGLSIAQVAEKVGVSRQTLHSWLARYEAQGLEGLVDRSHRPASCPHQMPAAVEAALLELRRSRPYWGPRRLVFELAYQRLQKMPPLQSGGLHDGQTAHGFVGFAMPTAGDLYITINDPEQQLTPYTEAGWIVHT